MTTQAMTTSPPTASSAGTLHLTSVPYSHPALRNRIRRWDDQEQVHQAVMSLFRPDLPGDQRARRAGSDILYRLDDERQRLLVQATTTPQRTDHGIRLTTLDGLLDRLAKGQRVRFTADLNAVRCQARTGRRLPVPAHELAEWVLERLTPALDKAELLDAPVQTRYRGRVPLVVARVTGTATITDRDALAQKLRVGVGRGRAYGCGLLTVLPLAS
jgi:CRISPR system Cascade subunit CasE